MKTIDLGSDDGKRMVKMGDVTREIDLWATWNKLADANNNHLADGFEAITNAIVTIIEGIGFPTPSHKFATAFYEQVKAEIEEEKKKGQPAPATTETPS